jgi:hypothetical protein
MRLPRLLGALALARKRRKVAREIRAGRISINEGRGQLGLPPYQLGTGSGQSVSAP